MSPRDVAADAEMNICIMGAARTGTHLMNGIICQTGETTPLLPEAHPLADLAVFYRQLRRHADAYPESPFAAGESVLGIANAPLKVMIGHLQARYETRRCVFRAPALSAHAEELYALFASLEQPFRFVCMLRDPRDAITSMFRWNERRVARGLSSLAAPDQDLMDVFIQRFWAQYKALLPMRDRPELIFVRYEDLVADPTAVAGRIYTELGLDASRFDPAARWSHVEADLSQAGKHGDCITDLYSEPVSRRSVGAFRTCLDAEQEKRVFNRLAQFRRTFYPELTLASR